ncbi:DNA-packaging protein [Ligilactobacillus salivarius]|jgi:hypothetical protein|nr:DNA-packaging protein [Ligilactobacillus salivarius]
MRILVVKLNFTSRSLVFMARLLYYICEVKFIVINKTLKLLIAVITVVGYTLMVVNKVNIGYMIIGLLVIVLISFLLVPEIKQISTKYFSLSKKVNEAMVQYKEFKETVYPILQIELANISSVGYMDAGPKSNELVEFLEKIKKIKINDDRINNLIVVAKSQVLLAFKTELAYYNSKAKGFISTGLKPYYSDDYIDKDSIFVDFKGLENLIDEIEDIKTKGKYQTKLHKLKQFYNENF